MENDLMTEQSVVIDLGGFSCNVGFSGRDAPTSSFRTVSGVLISSLIFYPDQDSKIQTKKVCLCCYPDEYQEVCVGEEILSGKKIERDFPISKGKIVNWQSIEHVFDHAFKELTIDDPADTFVMVTENPLQRKSNREKLTVLMFEKYELGGYYLASKAMNALYCSGRVNGVIFDCGHEIAHAVPIVKSQVISGAVVEVAVGGRWMDQLWPFRLEERGYEDVTIEIARDIKEKCCWIELDYESRLCPYSWGGYCEHEYQLPDGSHMTIGRLEQFQTPEILFRPAEIIPTIKTKKMKIPPKQDFAKLNMIPIDSAIMKSIGLCVGKFRDLMFENIVLCGGSTNFEGIEDRLTQEICRATKRESLKKGEKKIGNTRKVVNVPPKFASIDRKLMSWIGGSIRSSLSSFEWIKREEYDDVGASIVLRKSLF